MIGCVRWYFSQVDSTQRVAFDLAMRGARHGTVVRAGFQSAGRGRQDREWESAPGSALMFSVVLRPTLPLHELGSVSVRTAEVLADAFSELIDAPAQIKWPNDVLIDGFKVSGILMQTRNVPEPVAVLGIGINISDEGDQLPVGATALGTRSIHPVDTDALYDALLARLETMWAAITPQLAPAQLARLDERLWQRGEQVSLLDGDRETQGQILGIAKSGGLRLSIHGSVKEILAGEITRGPRPISSPETN